MNIDTDGNMNVVTVYGSEATIWGHRYDGVRKKLRVNRFATYGAAVLWAKEYEEKQREELRRRQQ